MAFSSALCAHLLRVQALPCPLTPRRWSMKRVEEPESQPRSQKVHVPFQLLPETRCRSENAFIHSSVPLGGISMQDLAPEEGASPFPVCPEGLGGVLRAPGPAAQYYVLIPPFHNTAVLIPTFL